MEIGQGTTSRSIGISNTIDAQQCTATNYGGTSTAPKAYSTYCPHRLPCGYCQILFRDCPKGYVTTWTTTATSTVD